MSPAGLISFRGKAWENLSVSRQSSPAGAEFRPVAKVAQFLNIDETVETTVTTGRGVAYEGSPELFELYRSA